MENLYSQMTTEEQVQWIASFTDFMDNSLPSLVGKKDALSKQERKMMEEGLHLLLAFPFSKNFAQTALQYGDYERRTYRLPYYVDKIKKEISSTITVMDGKGNAFAYVPKLPQTHRRRGRPTREETYLRMNNQSPEQKADIETEKQQRIAKMLGLNIITNPQEREKNNDELRAEREAKAKAEAETNPSLFNESNAQGTMQATQIIPPMADTQPALRQLTFLLSPELAQAVATVRELRNRASVFSEQAKFMAEHGENAERVSQVAMQAAEATEAYEQIYERVDKELATVYVRLREDNAFRDDFVKKHYKNMPVQQWQPQMNQLEKLLKPYYSKQDKTFVSHVRKMIAENNPEVVAAKKAAKQKKVESEKIIKYLRRTDKQNSLRRIEGMEAKYKELVDLIGEEQAKPYYAFVEAAKKDFENKQEK